MIFLEMLISGVHTEPNGHKQTPSFGTRPGRSVRLSASCWAVALLEDTGTSPCETCRCSLTDVLC